MKVIDSVWKHIVFIKDDKSPNKVFGFMRKYPFICAQADNIDEVKEKIDKYFKRHKKEMGV